MTKNIFISFILLSCFIIGCRNNELNADKINIIFETDIGNDIDDAMALDMLYKYLDSDKINLLAININKEGLAPAEFVDIMNTWYGYPEIPIGIIREGADCETDAVNYAQVIVNLKKEDGTPFFTRSQNNYDKLPEAHELYRKILAEMPDKSVTIVSVGFSTNLARLMETPADQYSSLTGMELISKKVKLLVTMAGHTSDMNFHEYNVKKDPVAAKIVFEEWPTKIVTSPFEVGISILYPAESIENDFTWADNRHPMVEAYKAYLPMPYNRPTWDLTSVLYAVEGDSYFTIHGPFKMEVTELGGAIFIPQPEANRYYLMVDEAQAMTINQRFQELLTTKPTIYNKQ